MVSVFPMHYTDMLSNPADNVTRAGKLWEGCTPFAVAQSLRFTGDTSLYVKIRHQLDCKLNSPFRDQRRGRTSVCTVRAQQHFWIGAQTCDLQMSDHPWTGCTEGSGTRDLLWRNADSNLPRSGAGFRSDDGIEPDPVDTQDTRNEGKERKTGRSTNAL